MAILNMVASIVGGGGMEYEEGSFTVSSSTYYKDIIFSNPHSKAPALVVAEAIGDTPSTSRNSFCMIIVYQTLLGGKRNGRTYAQRIAGTSSSGITSLNTYSSSSISDILTSETADLTGTGAYAFSTGTWNWIAIWAPED